jgi:hypothetical protein
VPNAGTGRVAQFGILLLLLTTHVTGLAQNDFEWKDASGNTHNLADLKEILRRHQEWIGSGKKSMPQADLIGADLRGAPLIGANLDGAVLRGADLSDAALFGARLGQAMFEPKSLPKLREIAAAENLELLTYNTNPDALVQLRKQFEDRGFREQERKITYALKRRETELSFDICTSRTLPSKNSWMGLSGERAARARLALSSNSVLANCGSVVLNKLFFDWTCQYGMNPGRALSLGFLVWFVCSLVYFACVHTQGQAGLTAKASVKTRRRSGAWRKFRVKGEGKLGGLGGSCNSSGENAYCCERRCFSA